LEQVERTMNEQVPLPYQVAALGELCCIVNTVALLEQRRIHLPKGKVGMRLRFADGTSARVFRETVVDGPPGGPGTPKDPCVLVVEFRLWAWAVRGRRTHALFCRESLLNTPLFVGFPGFVSKLWMANDEHGVYRGVYEWDGPERAEHYARSLWRVLALECEPGSIHYRVLPGLRRDAVLAEPHLLDATLGTTADAATAWWRVIGAA
jgi:hypothetical protein